MRLATASAQVRYVRRQSRDEDRAGQTVDLPTDFASAPAVRGVVQWSRRVGSARILALDPQGRLQDGPPERTASSAVKVPPPSPSRRVRDGATAKRPALSQIVPRGVPCVTRRGSQRGQWSPLPEAAASPSPPVYRGELGSPALFAMRSPSHLRQLGDPETLSRGVSLWGVAEALAGVEERSVAGRAVRRVRRAAPSPSSFQAAALPAEEPRVRAGTRERILPGRHPNGN
jgi:hypothetical protein